MKPIATIRTDFPSKFGIPRQSGLVPALLGEVVFLPEYRNPDALRGIEDYSHLWLLWEFSQAKREGWSPTVRPPRLGGNRRMGVFATRSPFRPNPIGLSCVALRGVRWQDERGPVLLVAGADLLDGTPIFDIKPYLPYADSHPEALPGYTAETVEHQLSVAFPQELLRQVPADKRQALMGVLACDPRPGYEDKPQEIYGLAFAGLDIGFTVANGALTVVRVDRKEGT